MLIGTCSRNTGWFVPFQKMQKKKFFKCYKYYCDGHKNLHNWLSLYYWYAERNFFEISCFIPAYDKNNWQNQLCINYLPKYMSLVCIPSSAYFLMPLIPGNGFRAVKPIFLNSNMILISHFLFSIFSIYFSSNYL